jgi:hypothetical protein
MRFTVRAGRSYMRAHTLAVVPDRGARDGGWRRLGIAGRFRYCMNIQPSPVEAKRLERAQVRLARLIQ